MNRDIILLKTPRGREEVRTRAHGLPPLARRLLIMADGQRSVAELAAQLDREADDAELEVALAVLTDGRYLLPEDDYDRRSGSADNARAATRGAVVRAGV